MLLFTDGNVDDLMAIYAMIYYHGKIPSAIIVDEGVCSLSVAIRTVSALLCRMNVHSPIYAGSRSYKLPPREWRDNCHRLIDISWIKEHQVNAVPMATTSIVDRPIRAISLGPLTTVSKFIDAGKISSLIMFAGGDGEGLDMEYNVWADPEAYSNVMNREDIPKVIWTTDDITEEHIQEARSIVLNNIILLPMLDMIDEEEFRYWDLITVMKSL